MCRPKFAGFYSCYVWFLFLHGSQPYVFNFTFYFYFLDGNMDFKHRWYVEPCLLREVLLLERHLIVVLGFTFNVNRCSLARATGPFTPTTAPASWKWTAVSERPGVAQSNFWTRSMRPNKLRPGGF